MSWANKITVHLSSLTVYLFNIINCIFHHRFIHNHNHYSNHLNPKNLFSELHSGSLFTGFVSTSKATQWWWTFFTRQCPTYQFLCVSGGDTRITVLLGLLVPEGGKGHYWWRMVFKLELLRASCIVIFNRSLYAGSSNIFLSCNFHAKLVCN